MRIVRLVGLEPTRPKALEPKPSASANSATGAIKPASPGGRLASMRTRHHHHRLARKPGQPNAGNKATPRSVDRAGLEPAATWV